MSEREYLIAKGLGSLPGKVSNAVREATGRPHKADLHRYRKLQSANVNRHTYEGGDVPGFMGDNAAADASFRAGRPTPPPGMKRHEARRLKRGAQPWTPQRPSKHEPW